jgi:benzoyl-CoA-dihydrodiol lyase
MKTTYTQFESHPERYKHWNLEIQGPIAQLKMKVNPEETFAAGYELKLNSYDLGVDIELCDAVERLRFEHPEVNVVVVSSEDPKVFSAGANIFMLQKSTHPFKVNFCKFTNETRCAMEEATRKSDQVYIAALNGICAGGGYELALACEEIYLVEDGNSAVSLPEVFLLGVLPGTGGLTRLVDKRKIRRDHADIFSTLGEGIKGKQAKAWNFVDDIFPKSQFEVQVQKRAETLSERKTSKPANVKGIKLNPINGKLSEKLWEYSHVTVVLKPEERCAEITLRTPQGPQPKTPQEIEKLGTDYWPLKVFRELDDALLHLRLDALEIGLILMQSQGGGEAILEIEKTLYEHRNHWLCREIILKISRTLRRLDLTSKSLFALVDKGSAFFGAFLEVALACDRIYMLDDADQPVYLAVGPFSGGMWPMSNGLSRLQSRFLAKPEQASEIAKAQKTYTAQEAEGVGLVTIRADELDWEDEVRLAIEERLSLSPDALTGMEASLRFGGPETCDSKIFGRLSDWQNWIFIRPNAVGEEGALNVYGKSGKPKFDWRRT